MAATKTNIERKWLSTSELANELGVPTSTVRGWRRDDKGPLSRTFGKHVRYSRADIDAWTAVQEGRRGGTGTEG